MASHLRGPEIRPGLRPSRLQAAENQDADVLFYGSINDRRKKILRELKLKQRQIRGVPPKERDVIRNQIRELEQDYRDLTGKKIAKSSDGDVEIEVLDI